MTFDRIDRLVTEEGFAFQAWDDRYSKGCGRRSDYGKARSIRAGSVERR
jgi:hypothetical protein